MTENNSFSKQVILVFLLQLGVMFALFGSIAIGGTKVIWISTRSEKSASSAPLSVLGYLLGA